MLLARASIERKITFSMLYLIVVGFGLFSLTQLKIDLFPDIQFPVIGIITFYEGVGPADIEKLVTRPLEESVAATKHVKKVNSTSSQGSSIILLQFDWGTDIDQAEMDVRKRIDLVRDLLPEEASEPLVFPFDPSLQPIMFLGLSSSSLGPAELRKLADERLEAMLERVDGVASAVTQGGLERQINVKLNPLQLAAFQLSPLDVVGALQREASLQPAGRIETHSQNLSLRILSEYYSLDDIQSVVVKYVKGVPVYLKDVAEIEDGFKERFGDARTNFNPGVVIQVNKQSDANTVLTCRRVRQTLSDIEAILPEGTSLGIVFDASEFIMRSIYNLRNSALQAFLMSFLVLLLFLANFRGSLIMAVSIPVAILATFPVMHLAHLTLNIVTMAGLALAVGMLVDNAIVVLENIYRYHESGTPLSQAADVATSEVGLAITASTLTTISVFVPVLFVPGIAGELFSDMVVVMCFSLGASLLIALTLIPLLSHQFLKIRPEGAASRWSRRIREAQAHLSGKYLRILHWCLGHRKKTLLIAGLLLVISIALTATLGGEFLPRTDQNLIIVRVDREIGTPLEETEKTVLDLENIVREEVPELENLYVLFGAGEGITAIFTGTASYTIFLRIRLSPMEERKRSQFEIQDALRKRLQEVPGIRFEFIEPTGFTTERPIEVKLLGPNLLQNRQLAEQIKASLEKIPGLVDVSLNVRESTPELQIIPERERLNDFKLSVSQVAHIISTAFQGKVAALYREGADEYNIFVQLDRRFRRQKEAIANLLIPTPAGKLIPLGQLAQIREEAGPASIYRENQQRMISVGCNLSGIDLSSAVAKIRQVLQETPIPSDVQVLIGGTAQDQQEAFYYLRIAFIAAVLLVYMVMASQFESLVDPFIIFFTIPLAFIGVGFMLFLTQTPLSVMSLVGIVMLVGIVVNNGIVLVDYTNQLRRRGMPLHQAVVEAARIRMRPVLMTALTTILAMVPLALELGAGSENWSAMARSVIGGMTTSTLLTLVIVPVLYTIVEELESRIVKSWRRWRSG
ncbi:MAG: efflux RND transporter permease subunit [Calditrichaeota bacterium]|nr:MAG: efflux RND transporter permease subunit [Calditrichota bacterium]